MLRKLMRLAVFLVVLLLLPLTLRAAEILLGTSGGIYTVQVQVNGSITTQFLVDPGAGVVVIPLAMLRSLVANGTVTQSDVIGIGTAELADSSLYLTARVRLRELRIGNIAVRDVMAAVSPRLSQPLLGQSFLQKFSSVTFDNRRGVMILSDDASSAYPYPPAPPWVAPYPSYPSMPFSGGGYRYPGYDSGLGR